MARDFEFYEQVFLEYKPSFDSDYVDAMHAYKAYKKKGAKMFEETKRQRFCFLVDKLIDKKYGVAVESTKDAIKND